MDYLKKIIQSHQEFQIPEEIITTNAVGGDWILVTVEGNNEKKLGTGYASVFSLDSVAISVSVFNYIQE